ncbi:hypothetical protein GW17_00031303 [Ensete ventricosum]|nr:hypothetical protein GW17_00031303 [Ensete ventricosum]
MVQYTYASHIKDIARRYGTMPLVLLLSQVLPKPKSLIFHKIVTILPSCIFAEAGGIATDAAGNNLDFSKGRYLDLDTGIIVTNKKLMPSLLNAVQEAIREQTQSSASHL